MAPPRPAAGALRGLFVLADDDPRWPHDPVAQAEAACAGGATVVQLRAKHARDAETLSWARAIRALTRRAGAAFFVNDRFDLALASDADGVHLGQDDLPPDRLPADARARLWIGRSTHDLDQVRAAGDEPVDYVAFGPVFGTTSKDSPYPARGLAALADAARAARPRPLIAIGGVTRERLAELAHAGAAGFAVVSAVADAADPAAATAALAAAWERAAS